MNKSFIESKIQFYIPEIIIFCIYASIYCYVSILKSNFDFFILIFGLLSFIFFIIEHRIDVIFDKLNDTVIVYEKMLFCNKYRIKNQQSLSLVSDAYTEAISKYDRKKGRYETYRLKITNKDGSTLFPFGEWSNSNSLEWEDMAIKINNFNQSSEPTLILSRKPFFFRLFFGIPLGIYYFLAVLRIIFPNEIEPIIYKILNMWCSLNGYHQ